MIEFYIAISAGCAVGSIAKAHRAAFERLQKLGVVEFYAKHSDSGTFGNSSLGQSLNDFSGAACNDVSEAKKTFKSYTRY